MALGVTGDNNAYALLKEYYGEQKLEALVFRNDPVLGNLKKERIGGKYIPLPMAVYGNGGVTADYTQVTAQAANTYSGVSMQVTPGHLFSSFVLDWQEFAASQGNRAAFLSVFAVRAFLAMDDLRKMLAACLYRSGYLEMGPVNAVDSTNYIYVDVDPSTAMAITPGAYILFGTFTNGSPGVMRSPNAVQVKSVGNVYNTGYTRITFQSAYVNTVEVADYLFIKGGMDSNNAPNAPVGLAQWLPAYGNRTGTGWTTYIGTNFYGVNRSIAPDRLAGQYVYRNIAAGETYTQALLRGVKVVRRGGGVPTMLVVNDDDYGQILQDALANRTFYQDINGGGMKGKNAVTQGIDQFQLSFSTSWINMVYDSPYCPRNYAYILDEEAIRLYGISNTADILKELPLGNEAGAPLVTSASEPTTNFVFLADDMYTTSPVPLQSGMGLKVDFQFLGNFAVTAPAHCGVVQFN